MSMKDPKPACYILIEPSSMTKKIKDEVRIYDDANFVASLGGFLGLFVGFSFHGTFCYLIDKLSELF